MVSPCSDRISRVPPYSRTIIRITRTGLSPATAALSRAFRLSLNRHWPGPRSLATTCGVSVDVLSCGYLDVSVPRVRFLSLFYSKIRYLLSILGNHSSRLPRCSDFPSTLGGFPHSEIAGSKGIRTSPTLIAAYHVLHRLCMPRHPPIALKTLDHSHCQCPSFLLGT